MTTKTDEPKTIEQRLARLEDLEARNRHTVEFAMRLRDRMLDKHSHRLEGLQKHIRGLYVGADGTVDPKHVDDPNRLLVCAEAIELMKLGEKFTEIGNGGAVRTACEIVAYYEAEKFVAAA